MRLYLLPSLIYRSCLASPTSQNSSPVFDAQELLRDDQVVNISEYSISPKCSKLYGPDAATQIRGAFASAKRMAIEASKVFTMNNKYTDAFMPNVDSWKNDPMNEDYVKTYLARMARAASRKPDDDKDRPIRDLFILCQPGGKCLEKDIGAWALAEENVINLCPIWWHDVPGAVLYACDDKTEIVRYNSRGIWPCFVQYSALSG